MVSGRCYWPSAYCVHSPSTPHPHPNREEASSGGAGNSRSREDSLCVFLCVCACLCAIVCLRGTAVQVAASTYQGGGGVWGGRRSPAEVCCPTGYCVAVSVTGRRLLELMKAGRLSSQGCTFHGAAVERMCPVKCSAPGASLIDQRWSCGDHSSY